MGRKRRIEYYGAIYHIIHKGNNKESILKEETDKMEFLKILGEVKEKFDFYLLGYVLMNNSYHFIIKTHNIYISKIMHRINTNYAKYYNIKYKKTGSPFKGRYKSILIKDRTRILDLLKYIHNKPVLEGICNSMIQYKWSSDPFYRMNVENLIDMDEILSELSLDRIKAIDEYKIFMEEVEEDYKNLSRKYEEVDIIGNREEKIIKRALDNILESVCESPLDFKLIKEGSRKRYLSIYKRDYINKSMDKGYRIEDIGANINITGRGIRKLLN